MSATSENEISAPRKLSLPEGTAVIRIGAYHYPVLLRPEYGPSAYEEFRKWDGTPVTYSRRSNAVKYLWRRYQLPRW